MRVGWLGVMLCGVAVAQTPQLPEQDRALSREIFKQLIEVNSEDSDGSVTAAALVAREQLLKAGFAAVDLTSGCGGGAAGGLDG